MIPRKEIEKAFSNKEQERMLIMAQIQFPTEKQVLADVDVVKAIQRFKKHAFMDSVNTNKLAKDMRPELLNTKVQKNRQWVDNVDGKVQARLGERIKIQLKKGSQRDLLDRGLRAPIVAGKQYQQADIKGGAAVDDIVVDDQRVSSLSSRESDKETEKAPSMSRSQSAQSMQQKSSKERRR